MLAILLAHAAAAVVAPALVRRWDRRAFPVLALVPAGSLTWVATNWPTDGYQARVDVPWVPELSMDIALRFDPLAAVMSVIVLGVGALVLLYCTEYFHHHDGRREDRLPSFAAQLVAFAGAMFGLVTADNMLLLYVFWELTTVLSFLLVGHYAERATSRRAAMQALLVTTAGGLSMLVGIIVLGTASGTYLISELVAAPPTGTAVNVALALVLIGAISKSALVPLHFWLPGAMAAPTPVSAYLHAAAMVKAGVYLVARLTPGFADAPPWRPTVVVLGSLTLLIAGWRALREYDLKLVLAYGTVSQLGMITVMVGTGGGDMMLAGLALLCAHAMFKATLFMVVGVIDHATGTRDIRELAWLGARSPALLVIAAAAAASMAGLPPFFGFVAKEADFETLLHSPQLGGSAPFVLAAIVLGSTFTFMYSLRVVWGGFARKGQPEPSPLVARMHRPSVVFLASPAVLATAGLLFGVFPSPLDSALSSYARTLSGGVDYYLALWHGFGLPVVLSAVVIGVGTAAFFGRRRLPRLRSRWLSLGDADERYDAVVSAADRLSLRATGVTQRGSIPAIQATVMATLVLLPLAMLAWGARDRVELRPWDSPLQAVIGVLIIAAALGATVTRNRLAVVLLISLTGYGTGVVFALHGAPDLALTQFLVETVLLVVFVLVLRTLPAETSAATVKRLWLPRAALSVAVGATVTTVAAFAMAARDTVSVATLLPDAAYYRGNGSNAVNVILVDIRAWDTLGEVCVLLIAATGVASMVFRHRRFGAAPRVPGDRRTEHAPRPSPVILLRGNVFRDPAERSLVLEVATRMVFPLIMALSLYFFFTGHNTPGGGFAGGLTAGLALSLRYLAGGRYELGETLPLDAGKVLGAGLTLAAGTAVVSLFLGAPVLSSATLEATLPVLGDVKLVTSLFFDAGVYLIVVGLVLDILRSLGARLDDDLGKQRPVAQAETA